jgi:uncharacterized membrane protein YhaH (DUF805 family)
MVHASQFVVQLLDPRGRCDRRGFLIAASLLLSAQALLAAALWLSGAGFDGGAALAVNAGFCWLGYAAVSKRLHDTGRSGWWFAAGVLAWLAASTVLAVAVAVAAGSAQLVPGTRTHDALFVSMLLPLVAALIWLHLAAGEHAANKYGPVPSSLGFSVPGPA